MTWKEFKDGVIELLTVDGGRFGAENFIDRQIRSAVIDLQIHIPSFQIDQITFFTYEELGTDRLASVGTTPQGSRVREWWVVDSDLAEEPDPDNRVRLRFFPWEDCEALAREGVGRYGPRFCLNPDRKDFLITPVLDVNRNLLLNWDGVQRTFDDETPVSFPETAMQAVYYYVKGHALLDLDHDRNHGLIYFNTSRTVPGFYQEERSKLWLEANRR